jgi:hypothetical protein
MYASIVSRLRSVAAAIIASSKKELYLASIPCIKHYLIEVAEFLFKLTKAIG